MGKKLLLAIFTLALIAIPVAAAKPAEKADSLSKKPATADTISVKPLSRDTFLVNTGGNVYTVILEKNGGAKVIKSPSQTPKVPTRTIPTATTPKATETKADTLKTIVAKADTLKTIVAKADTLKAIVTKADSINAETQAGMSTSWANKPKMAPSRAHVAWGAEFSSTIDMSGNEMSSIDFNVFAGISYKWLSLFGVGAGADIMVSNSNRTYPIFAVFRTDFSKLVKVVFLDLRGGVALNFIEKHGRQTGAYASPSIGFNLATGANFRSYITVGYTYLARRDIVHGEEIIPNPSLSMATIRLGLAF